MELTHWKIIMDEQNSGIQREFWKEVQPDAVDITVPCIAQVVYPWKMGVFWYWTEFDSEAVQPHERVLLKCGAVDYYSEIWLNGVRQGDHEGGEMPFSLDVTDALKARNLLCIRVVKPGVSQPIDGWEAAMIPHGNMRDDSEFYSGSMLSTSGIVGRVVLKHVSEAHFTDIHCVADMKNSRMDITGTVVNASSETIEAACSTEVTLIRTDDACGHDDCTVVLAPHSETQIHVQIPIASVKLWKLTDPNLYRVDMCLKTPYGRDRMSCQTGFRELRVEHGYFYLNGERIFIKCTHTGNHIPGSWPLTDTEYGFLRKDLVLAKAEGFNMVRFISEAPKAEQLDFCDEIGLMVYEENRTSWGLGIGDKTSERFNRELEAMVLRDRNHPCVAAWGLMNENNQERGEVLKIAIESLQHLRQLDTTRLVFLSSGRWDYDPHVGSISNPGSISWECVWGIEDENFPQTYTEKQREVFSWEWWKRSGDVHPYPDFPLSQDEVEFMRHLGHDSKPVFISETGIGSMFNVLRACRNFEGNRTAPEIFDYRYCRELSELFLKDWNRWGFADLYPFPEDLLTASERQHSRQRRLFFDLLRSNPRNCGYSATGMLDHALTGEGFWSLFREWKAGIAEVLADGWAPLRWCLFTPLAPVYEGASVALSAVLANEGILKQGTYQAVFKVFADSCGVVWEKAVTFTLEPEGNGIDEVPLATPVLNETIQLELTPGVYTFAAELLHGGMACANRQTFRIATKMPALPDTQPVMAVEVTADDLAFFKHIGLNTVAFDPGRTSGLLIIGHGNGHAANPDDSFWTGIHDFLTAGGKVLACSATAFPDKDAGCALKIGKTLKYMDNFEWGRDWLYHKESVLKRDPLFDGVAPAGLLDWEIASIMARGGVWTGDDPDTMFAAAFGLGMTLKKGYLAGVKLGEYHVGKGILVMNGFNLPPANLGEHLSFGLNSAECCIPAADRLFLNLLKRYGG